MRIKHKRLEYQKNYSHCQKKPWDDELQEKWSPLLLSSDALKEEQEYFSWEGLLMVQPPQPPPKNAPWRQSKYQREELW
jgi:hypothetical protein